MNIKILTMTAGALGALTITATAHAATPGLTYTGSNGENLANGPFTLGWQFDVNSAITVSGLGVFDSSLDGLNASHDVGIFNSSGGLLASTTVAAGTGETLIDNFRYHSISPFSLGIGTYYIGALWADGSDANVFTDVGGSLSTVSAITYVQATFASGGSLAAPTSGFNGTPGYFGPNLLVGSAAPEPTGWAMMIVGFGGLGAMMRRRRTVTA